MSNVRTQESRHWVRLEWAGNQDGRQARDFDLNMVDEIHVIFGENPNDPIGDKNYAKGIKFTYAGLMKPIELSNGPPFTYPAAQWFWQRWNEFIDLKAKGEPAPLGVIQIAGASAFTKK